MYDAFFDLIGEIETDPDLKIVIFESANPDFFIAHYSTAESRSRFGTPPWIEAAKRLQTSSVVSVATIRGRVRGGGNEFILACDVRFASREKAIFGQPEVGTGLIPGGGALERLPLLVGRSRAIEIILGSNDFDAETAERYGWINRALKDSALDSFVDTFERRIAAFDKQALTAAKAIVNNVGLPNPTQLQTTQDLFFKTFGWQGARERAPKLRELGIGQAGDFELNLGCELEKLAPLERK